MNVTIKTGEQTHAEVRALSDADLMAEASDWISDAISEYLDGGGPLPSEIRGKYISLELMERSDRATQPSEWITDHVARGGTFDELFVIEDIPKR